MEASHKGKLVFIALGLVLYLLSAGISYASFSYLRPGVGVTPIMDREKRGQFKVPEKKYAGMPRTEPCPLNGLMYPKPQRELWEGRRPLGVMIENSREARPQSGLSLADVVYEAVAEGGITRLLAVYYCEDAEVVGPVRSARTYYLDWISEYGSSPLYAHVGGANISGPADALGQIENYGWGAYNDLNQFSIGFPTFWRDYERLGPDTATEHTVYASTEKLWSFAAKKRDLTSKETDSTSGEIVSWDEGFVPWKFKDDVDLNNRPQSFSAEFNFSPTQSSYISDYLARWRYDRESNSYLRFTGGAEHRDINTGQQLLAKNVVILYQSMGVADDGYDEEGHGRHTLYGTKGSGRARFFLDGKVIDGSWSKKTRIDRTRLFDATGQEIKLNRGLTWIEILPIGQPMTVN